MNIPFMKLDRQFSELKPEIMSVVEKVFTHGRVLQGNEVKELEKQLADLFEMKEAIAVGSGTDALIFSLKALGLPEGSKVAVTSLSFVASASCIIHNGCIPIFVDIDDYFLAQEEQLLSLIRSQSVDAVIVVHLYGQMMELENIYSEAKARGIRVIEDAAQCLGATRNSYPPGKFSDIVCVSFDPTKVVGAYGSGGAVMTDNSEIAEKIIRFRYHGHIGKRVYDSAGFNSQLATVQAAILSVKLKYLKKWQRRRIAIAEQYNDTLKNIQGINIPNILPGNEHIFHKYVLTIKDKRDELSQYLKDRGIGTSVHYNPPLHLQPCFRKYSEDQTNLPFVEATVKKVLSLPIYPEMTDEEVSYISNTIQSFWQ